MHRVGALKPGDNIVLVVTASAHREAAFAAAEFLMDYLKTRAPFWKKETRADGAARWVDARDSDEARRGGGRTRRRARAFGCGALDRASSTSSRPARMPAMVGPQ